jgi:hypothetical protein
MLYCITRLGDGEVAILIEWLEFYAEVFKLSFITLYIHTCLFVSGRAICIAHFLSFAGLLVPVRSVVLED